MNGKCPVCGKSEYTDFRMNLLRCTSCNLVVSPLVWLQNANEAMEDEWFGQNYQAVPSLWVKLFETWNNRKTLRRLAAAGFGGGRLLEIGVGSGSFLKAAQDAGFIVSGFDLSRAICERVEKKYGISMHNESIEKLQTSTNFDIIVMNHVLEHVGRPVEFLQGVRCLLATGGLVHIAVPNIACWEANLSGWTSYETYHLAYFKQQTLNWVVATAGLEVERLETFDSFSGWFLAVVRTALCVNRSGCARERPKTMDVGRAAVVEHVYRLAMVATGLVLWPLRWFQANLGYGDELVCLARKAGV